MAEVADHHFWFRGTRRVILDQARQHVGADLESLQIADIGCGPGTTLRWLSHCPNVVGVDLQPVAIELAKERAPNATVIQGDAHELPLEDQKFDLVFCLDLLEHLEEPARAASEIYRILKPGGCLIATVPAWQFMYGSHDRALMHQRRYSRKDFRALLQGANFSINRLSFYNSALFFPIAALRAGRKLVRRDTDHDESKSRTGDLNPLPRPINRVLESVLGTERFWLRKMNLPVGVSLIAAAHRPTETGA